MLHGEDASSFSGLTLFDGPRRAIVHNEAHSPGRQASDIAHEQGHGLRMHPPAPLHDGCGCRKWNADHEDEATFLAGALLVPAKAGGQLPSSARALRKQRGPLGAGSRWCGGGSTLRERVGCWRDEVG
ncbi:ImmA/IrrE family metallo-endopeptidase [Nocardia sp. NBC_00508]|uniref:ImmA/IrrE family metallo-endopeptidase n=1 Tax=Nocardia sp. NBC_00508 TaxID=2975992 RepID=UPI003FA59D4A